MHVKITLKTAYRYDKIFIMTFDKQKRRFVLGLTPAAIGALFLSKIGMLGPSERTVIQVEYNAHSVGDLKEYLRLTEAAGHLKKLKTEFSQSKHYKNTMKFDRSGLKMTSTHIFQSEKDLYQFIEITNDPKYAGHLERQILNIRRVRRIMTRAELFEQAPLT